jgi:hypothetical protein
MACRAITSPWSQPPGHPADARQPHAVAWLAGAMEQVFLRRSVPGIIGFGRARCVRYFPCGDEAAWIPLGQKTLGESGTTF